MGLIREIPAGERWHAAQLVEEWGYPRATTHREVETGRWFTNDTAIVWYDQWEPSDVFAVHGIGDPARKCQALTPRTAVALEVIAELLGARKLYSLIPRETPNMPVLAMRRYLRRYGWTEDDIGSYKLLGG